MPDDTARGPSELLELAGDAAGFLLDVGRLLRGVLGDRRVPRSAKLVAGGALAYVVSPVDLVPDMLPVLGQLDDLWVVTRALRHLASRAGEPVLRDHWHGSEEGLRLVLTLARVERAT